MEKVERGASARIVRVQRQLACNRARGTQCRDRLWALSQVGRATIPEEILSRGRSAEKLESQRVNRVRERERARDGNRGEEENDATPRGVDLDPFGLMPSKSECLWGRNWAASGTRSEEVVRYERDQVTLAGSGLVQRDGTARQKRRTPPQSWHCVSQVSNVGYSVGGRGGRVIHDVSFGSVIWVGKPVLKYSTSTAVGTVLYSLAR